MHRFKWSLVTAWRDGRGSGGKAILHAVTMALGVAALVALTALGADMKSNIKLQVKELLGADMMLWDFRPFEPEAEALIAELPGDQSVSKRLVTMARFEGQEASRLVRVLAVEPEFPYYGRLKTVPESAADDYHAGRNVLVAEALLLATGAKVGDSVQLGHAAFTIAGILKSAPGTSPGFDAVSPPVYMPLRFLEETGLLQRGSRVFNLRYIKLPEDMDVEARAEKLESDFKDQDLTVFMDTVKEREEDLGRAMENLYAYLGLVACVALLLGGLGVSGAVFYYMRRKQREMATLRCLGVTVRQLGLVYGLQVMGMTLLAVLIGVAVGVGVQFYVPSLIARFLPFEFEASFQWGAVLWSAFWSLLLSATLVFLPLIGIRNISPMMSFRVQLERPPRDHLRSFAIGVTVVAWWLFAVFQTGSWWKGLSFVVGLAVVTAVLLGCAKAMVVLARRWVSDVLPYVWRQALANLFRPYNQTSLLVCLLGMGLFLVALLGGIREMLLGQFNDVLNSDSPNFIVFDIQKDQREGVRSLVRDNGFEIKAFLPIVPMQISALEGKSLKALKDSEAVSYWAAQREYRSTYRAEMGPSEALVEGVWVADVPPGDGPVPVSLEVEIADRLDLQLNDEFELDVQGVPIAARVASLREVDWSSMQPNFYMVFPRGVLEEAPQMFVLTTRTDGPVQVAQLQNKLTSAFPTVTSMDLSLVAKTVNEIITKASSAVRVLAGVTVAIGFLLLASAVWNSRAQRMGEQALLRTLGARRAQLLKINAIEYFLLGAFASLAGVLLAIVSTWLLGLFLFELPAFPNPLVFLTPLVAMPLLTTFCGHLSMGALWRGSARDVLRREAVA